MKKKQSLQIVYKIIVLKNQASKDHHYLDIIPFSCLIEFATAQFY